MLLLHGRSFLNTATGHTGPSQLSLQETLECVTDGVVTVDSQWRYLYVNNAAARFLEKSPQELVGRVIWDVFPESKTRPSYELLCRAMQERKPVQYEQYRPAPLDRWFEVRFFPNSDGAIILFADVSERKNAEQHLRDNETRFQRHAQRWEILAQTAADLLVAPQPQTVVDSLCRKVMAYLECDVFVNYLIDEPTRRLHLNACGGFPDEDVKRLEWLEIGSAVCGCVAREGCAIKVENVQSSGDSRADLIKSLGIQAYCCHPLLGEFGRVIGTLSFGTRNRPSFSPDDIALMKAVSDQVAVAMARLISAQALREQAQQAQQANQAKDHFLAVLSHELRTPLTPVLAASQSLEHDTALTPEQHDLARVIRRNVELEARLIDDLLDLTRITRNKLELHVSAVDVHEKIRHVLAMCAADATAGQLHLSTRLLAQQHHIQADPARFQQILWNVIKNAIKFTPRAGQITLQTRDHDGQVIVECIDTGVGISNEALPRIFDAFEQGGREVTRQFGGLGLGLAITKALVECHGGQISASSAGAGMGTTVTIALPATQVQKKPASATGVLATLGGAYSILLVEDHEDTRRILTRLLTRLGCSVTTASSVQEGLLAAASRQFDLLVSDIGLPDGSGTDLMRQLKARHGLRGIALSGYGMEDDIKRSLDAGFETHLVKPVNVQLLQDTLRRFLTPAAVSA